MTDEPTITCATPADWDAWLEANHASASGVWVKIAKKASGIASITAPQGTTGALCFGWIDGHRRGLDDQWFLQRYSPRTKRSSWSALNVAAVLELERAGRMRPAGLAAVEAAKADGRWTANLP